MDAARRMKRIPRREPGGAAIRTIGTRQTGSVLGMGIEDASKIVTSSWLAKRQRRRCRRFKALPVRLASEVVSTVENNKRFRRRVRKLIEKCRG